MGQVSNIRGAELFDVLFRHGLKLEHLSKNATAEMAIPADSPPLLFLDPNGGAKTVLLPPEADANGMVLVIVNTADAAETITVEEDSSTTAIGSIAQNKAGIFVCNGTAWRSIVGA